ncbi:hypothetical protein EST55_09400 [Idiomarina sp. 29L]|uniref:PH domain-containing protein n=1 Tax=Idiomarina sp. 29L TaxID=2508877 RepID=UPI00101051CA|nr:PH domain-containing protein [Idiomarina sp. 29L]RXS41923.1 hypothetical protein EST55_09400 [Idiomarina sp. 29L]
MNSEQITSINNSTEEYRDKWLKLSPVAIIYFAIQFIKNTASNFVYLIPAFVIGYQKLADNIISIIVGVTGVLVFIAVSALVKFYFYQYRITGQRAQIHSGVFQKKHIDLPFERIQNIRFEQPIYYRFTDHVCMLLDTAGSSKAEAKIIALPKPVAEALKQEILLFKDHKTNTEDHPEPEQKQEERETVLNTRSVRDLVIHGLASNRIWIVLGALAPFFNSISEQVIEGIESFGVDLEALMSSTQYAMWQYILVIASATFVIIALLALVSVIGSVITFYDFRLTRSGDRYIRRNGLFTRHEVAMRLRRLQMIVYQQNWLDRLLQRVNLKFEQLNASIERYSASTAGGKIMVPSVTLKEAEGLAANAWPKHQMGTINFHPISKRLMVRNLLIAFWLLIVPSITFSYFGYYEVSLGLGGLFLLLIPLIALRWKRWGYANDGQFIYIRKGLIGVNYRCFPIHKVQQTSFYQSWFMRRFKLCTVGFVLACGGQSIPFIKEISGDTLIDETLHQVESLKKSWM